ncbi:hypothetical protein [Streptomyces sp. B27]|uniref:hypothetical protein n=1 Tax=Streptomyces TaxID=1883 RepID=UPI000FD6E360|nr:hypothetical protein [Streptomyces sp. B27]
MTSIASPLGAPRTGLADDMTEDDNQRGFERNETDRFHQLVRQMVANGDDRAERSGRRTRRTFQEMAPGQTRQPVLHLTRPLTFAPTSPEAGADDACGLCGWWKCRCGGAAPVPTPSMRAVAA